MTIVFTDMATFVLQSQARWDAEIGGSTAEFGTSPAAERRKPGPDPCGVPTHVSRTRTAARGTRLHAVRPATKRPMPRASYFVTRVAFAR